MFYQSLPSVLILKARSK